MLHHNTALALLFWACSASSSTLLHAKHPHFPHAFKRANETSDSLTSLTLFANAIQKGSFTDGTGEIGSKAGQALSGKSRNNFINICSGKVLTNGLQNVNGSCNGIVMGDIPAKTNMVSSIILYPENGSKNIQAFETFTIQVQIIGLVAGSFTNATNTYYGAPQTLKDGKVVGHTHLTLQDMGSSLNPQKPLDPTRFAFFKGIDNDGNGQGLLSAEVTGGLPAGFYRVCTMASASNHQAALMPVAQRGSIDDCTKFIIVENQTTANGTSRAGGNGVASNTSTTTNSSATASQPRLGSGGGNGGDKNGSQGDQGGSGEGDGFPGNLSSETRLATTASTDSAIKTEPAPSSESAPARTPRPDPRLTNGPSPNPGSEVGIGAQPRPELNSGSSSGSLGGDKEDGVSDAISQTFSSPKSNVKLPTQATTPSAVGTSACSVATVTVTIEPTQGTRSTNATETAPATANNAMPNPAGISTSSSSLSSLDRSTDTTSISSTRRPGQTQILSTAFL